MPQHAIVESHALRVAAVPAAHAYVRATTSAARHSGGLTMLDDPQPLGAPAGQWWPPVMLDASWITENSTHFDLLHVHFGIESFTLAELTDAVDALRSAGRALVFTVHDLENPQLGDQTQYLRQLAVLIDGADELITLTRGAADQIEQRWRRTSTVIAHPQMLQRPPQAPRPRTATSVVGTAATATDRDEPRRVGVHLRDLRPNIDAWSTVTAMLDAVDELNAEGCPATAVVDINDRVRDLELRTRLRSVVGSSAHGEWIEHPRYSDEALAESIDSLDIEVLPYRHGTHSGWLELCWDLGVDVLAPDVGFFCEQHEDDSIAVFDVASLSSAWPSAQESPPPASSSSFRAALGTLVSKPRSDRRALRHARQDARAAASRSINDAHLSVYRRALERVNA